MAKITIRADGQQLEAYRCEIRVGDTFITLRAEGDGLVIHSDGQLVVLPRATNSVGLKVSL